jgi:signal transduction histidine kinase
VELHALIGEVLDLLKPTCTHKRIEIGFEATAAPLAVWGEADSLRELVLNLVLNAVEAAKGSAGRPPRVAIELAEAEPGWAAVRVLDSGTGPSEATASRLFAPFVSDKPDGTGLGLFVARQIAESHGGRIDWRRAEEMTCFTLTLPISSGPRTSEKETL